MHRQLIRDTARRLFTVAALSALACQDANAPSGAAALAIVSGDGQTGTVHKPLAQPIIVKVTDPNGNPIKGETITFTVVSGGGSMASGSGTTANDGTSYDVWTLGTHTADSQRVYVIASDPATDKVLDTVTFSATPAPDVADSVTVKSGDQQVAFAGQSLTDSLYVTMKDQYGNAVPGVSVAWAVTGGGGAITPASAVSSAGGVAGARWTIGTGGGNQTATATVTGLAIPSVSFTAHRDPWIVVDTPTTNALIGDTIALRVQIRTHSTITNANVTFPGVASRNLTFSNTKPSGWKATVPLDPVAEGPVDAAIVATDGVHADTNTLRLRVDRTPPLLTVTTPYTSVVSRTLSGTVHVSASCADANGCNVAAGTASAATSLSTNIGVGGAVGTSTFTIVASDSAGNTARQVTTVYTDPGLTLSAIDSVPGTVIDATTDRLLYTNATSIRVKTRSTSADSLVSPVANLMVARLTANGVVAIFAVTDVTGVLREWRAGVLSDVHAAMHSNAALSVSGQWVLWQSSYPNEAELDLRDVVAGTNTVVTGSSGNNSNDVASNGDVVYWGTDYNTYRYRGGVTTPLTSSGPGTFNVYPTTDGTNVVFQRFAPGCSSTGSIYSTDGSTETTLATGLSTSCAMDRPSSYQAAGGWIAFRRPDGQIYERAPNGTITQASAIAGAVVQIEALNDDGRLVVGTAVRYVVQAGGSGQTQVGQRFGRAVARGGQLFVLLGPYLLAAQ